MKLEHEKLLSNFAFNFNLRRYSEEHEHHEVTHPLLSFSLRLGLTKNKTCATWWVGASLRFSSLGLLCVPCVVQRYVLSAVLVQPVSRSELLSCLLPKP